jgi:erythronate-4-phosphate dehydrogenase
MPAPLRILCDANVPLAAEALARYGAVRLLPGRAIDRAACRAADALVVRSVTRVDAALLDGTPVRFVGTATAGTDHVDLAYLAARRLRFAEAPGSNAESVVEWVLAALLALAADRGEGLRGRTLGVVGCGHVGGRLVPRAAALGLRVLACDPPLAAAAEARGEAHPFVPYARVLGEADALTFHPPLTRTGAYPTHHLLDRAALAHLRPGAWVLNASRGAVVDGAALAEALSGRVAAAALDVWEGEPAPDPALARRVHLATPHIAGYSYDAKVAGARMMEDALRAWRAGEGHPLPPPFGWDAAGPAEPLALDAPPAPPDASPAAEAAWLDRLVRGAYDLRADDARFRAALLDGPATGPTGRADAFTALRRTYPRRRAWGHFSVRGGVPDGLRRAVDEGLGMRGAVRGAP